MWQRWGRAASQRAAAADFMAEPLSVTTTRGTISPVRGWAQSSTRRQPSSVSAASIAACRAASRSAAVWVAVTGHAGRPWRRSRRRRRAAGCPRSWSQRPRSPLAGRGCGLLAAPRTALGGPRRAGAARPGSAPAAAGRGAPAIARRTLDAEPTSWPSTAAIAQILRYPHAGQAAAHFATVGSMRSTTGADPWADRQRDGGPGARR